MSSKVIQGFLRVADAGTVMYPKYKIPDSLPACHIFHRLPDHGPVPLVESVVKDVVDPAAGPEALGVGEGRRMHGGGGGLQDRVHQDVPLDGGGGGGGGEQQEQEELHAGLEDWRLAPHPQLN